MNNRYLLSLLITTLFFMTSVLRAETYDKETDYWLQQLDHELLKRDVYIQQKQEKIDPALLPQGHLRCGTGREI